VFKLDTREWFSENVGPVVACVDFDNVNNTLDDLITEMVIFDGKMLGA